MLAAGAKAAGVLGATVSGVAAAGAALSSVVAQPAKLKINGKAVSKERFENFMLTPKNWFSFACNRRRSRPGARWQAMSMVSAG